MDLFLISPIIAKLPSSTSPVSLLCHMSLVSQTDKLHQRGNRDKKSASLSVPLFLFVMSRCSPCRLASLASPPCVPCQVSIITPDNDQSDITQIITNITQGHSGLLTSLREIVIRSRAGQRLVLGIQHLDLFKKDFLVLNSDVNTYQISRRETGSLMFAKSLNASNPLHHIWLQIAVKWSLSRLLR